MPLDKPLRHCRRQGCNSLGVVPAACAGVSIGAAAFSAAGLGFDKGYRSRVDTAVAATTTGRGAAFIHPSPAAARGAHYNHYLRSGLHKRPQPPGEASFHSSSDRHDRGASRAGFKLSFGVLVGSAAALEASRPSRDPACQRHARASTEVGFQATSSSSHAQAMQRGQEQVEKTLQARLLEEQALRLRNEVLSMEEALATDRQMRLWRSLQEHMSSGSKEHGVPASDLQWGFSELLGVHLTALEAHEVLRLHDTDGDGVLNFHEFSDAHAHLKEDLNEIRSHEKASHSSHGERKHIDTAGGEATASIDEPVEITPAVKAIAILAYALPFLDICRHFAEVGTEAVVGGDMLDVLVVMQPVLLLATMALGCSSGLPHLARFNLHQAFTLDLVVTASQFFLAPSGWLNVASLGLCSNAEMQILSGLCFVIFMCSICYSCMATSLGVLPDQIPFISSAARRALDSIRLRTIKEGARQKEEGSPGQQKQNGRSNAQQLQASIVNFLLCFTTVLVYLGLLSGYWSMTLSGLFKYWSYGPTTEAIPAIMVVPFP